MMPETDLHVAAMVAERLRRSIAGEPFSVSKGANRIDVTISIGISTLETKQFFEEHPSLQPSEGGAQTEVGPEAEGDVVVRVTPDVEGVRGVGG